MTGCIVALAIIGLWKAQPSRAACTVDANGQAYCFGVCPCPFSCYCVGRDVGPGHCVGG